MKKAFIIGHHKNNGGAYSDHFKMNEYDFYNSMLNELKEIGDVYTHNTDINSYTGRCKETASRINQEDYDVVFALHFNAFYGRAEGCKALYYHSNQRGKDISEGIMKEFSECTGISYRGVKPLSSVRDRGFGEIAYTEATTILLEPFFGDNVQDCKKFNKQTFLDILRAL